MRFALICGIALLVISCNKKAAPTETIQTKPAKVEETQSVKPQESVLIDYVKMKYSSAIVVDMSELDGCGYMLKLDNGKKLQPSPPLSAEFRVNDLPVWIKFQIKKGAAGICMSGQIVTVTSIAKK